MGRRPPSALPADMTRASYPGPWSSSSRWRRSLSPTWAFAEDSFHDRRTDLLRHSGRERLHRAALRSATGRAPGVRIAHVGGHRTLGGAPAVGRLATRGSPSGNAP